MRKTILTVGLALLGGMGCLQAQVSLVNPVPKVVTAGADGLFNAPAEWKVVSDNSINGSIALKALQTAGTKVNANAAFTVTLGIKGDKSVKKFKKQIPAHPEGYLLDITSQGVTIAAADQAGLYYGVQTLLGIMAEGKLEATRITDWPDVRFRGVVEGFYGTPWSHEARLRQLEFYGRNKMNVYIYGPKDDPYHRDHWRTPYPDAEAKRLQELNERAKECGVNFYWAIHPGVDIKWIPEDRDALMKKFEKMYELGIRSFAVFFDDIWGEGTKADKQAELLNYIDNNFIQKKPDVAPLVMCPTEYNRSWANDEKGYLRTLGSQMNKSIEIMWTGNTVVACIDKATMEWVNQRIARKGYIWWNYPVTDFAQSHVVLGPVYGNGLDIADDVSGFVSNPMEHAEASKIALYGVADYTWNMKAFDSNKNWEKAIKDLMPGNADVLRTFALYNKDLGPNGHGFRREEGQEMKALADRIQSGKYSPQDLGELAAKCMELGTSADVLLGDNSNPGLIRELRPWLLQAKHVADYGQAVVIMRALMTQNSKSADFTKFYQQARSLQKQMYDLENSGVCHRFQSGIKVGSKVLMPTLNKVFADAVEAYNKANSTELDPVSEYNPYKLESDVKQLALLPVSVRGRDITIKSSNEVINWQAGGSMTITADRVTTLQGMDFNLGIPGVAKNFKLEILVDGQWKTVSLLHYKDDDPVIHTGNELGGMQGTAIRLTNISGQEQKVYFKNFKVVKK